MEKEVKVTFKTITPVWTGDAFSENSEIRPSSIMGSLRFWFEVYENSFNCANDKEKNGSFNDESGSSFDKGLENLIKKELESRLLYKSNSLSEDTDRVESVIRKVFNKTGFPLTSQIFGSTGWKSRIRLISITGEKYELEKNRIDFDFLDVNAEWWVKKNLFFNNKNIVNLFKNLTLTFEIEDSYEIEFKKFLHFYKDRVIIIGGKKSFGFGFGKINVSEGYLNDIQQNNPCRECFRFKKVKVKELPDDKVILGYNIKEFLRKIIKNKKDREKLFGVQGFASYFYFSSYIPEINRNNNLDKEIFMIHFLKECFRQGE